MKTRFLKISASLICLVFAFCLVTSSDAAIVWEDNFNDGNYDGWTVSVGDWRVSDGVLETYYVSSYIWRIWHPSTQVVGTWSFDVETSTFAVFENTFLFMANGTDTTFTYDGYGIKITHDDFLFMKFYEGSSIPLKMASIDGIAGSWAHVDITRNSTGEFHVYINATSSIAEPDISIVDTEYSYSEQFVINSNQEGFLLDNIVVDDEIKITPLVSTPTTTTNTTISSTTTNGGDTPPPIDTTLLIVGAGVVIVAAVVFMRRR
jgi:hypothetical protein